MITFLQKLLDVGHSYHVQVSTQTHSPVPDPNCFFSHSQAHVNTWNLQLQHFQSKGVFVENTWAMQTDRLRSLTFTDATNCHACVIHRSRSPKQRCSALYSTYCRCIIQQFTVSGCSLNGIERSMAHGVPLASQPRADCVCMWRGERGRELNVNIFKLSTGRFIPFLQIHLFLHRALLRDHSLSHMCKQTKTQDEKISIHWYVQTKLKIWNHRSGL